MTDIDIERLRELAKYKETFSVHYEGCEAGHFGCAVLALIDHLKKVESERDEAIGQSKSLLKHLKQAVANQKQSTDAALELFSRLQKAEAQRDKALNALVAITHLQGDFHEAWNVANNAVNAILEEDESHEMEGEK